MDTLLLGPLKVRPLSLVGLLVQALPSVWQIVRNDRLAPQYNVNLRLGLHHRVDELELSLSDLDDLLDETSPNLVLDLLNPVTYDISTTGRKLVI